MRFLLVTLLLFMQTLPIFSEKILHNASGFQSTVGNVLDFAQDEERMGLCLETSAPVKAQLGKNIDLTHKKIITKVTAFIKANSSKRLSVFLARSDKYGDVSYIAVKTDISDLGSDTQKIVLDLVESHTVNTKKYDYVLVVQFVDGGDDTNLVFYSIKINLK